MSFIHKAFSFTILLFTKNMQIKHDLRKWLEMEME